LLQYEIDPSSMLTTTFYAMTPYQHTRSTSVQPPLSSPSLAYGRGKRLILPNPRMTTSRVTQNFTTFEFPNSVINGVPSARGTSILNNIEMDEEYLGFDSYFDMVVLGIHAEDLTQSTRKQGPKPVGSSDPPSTIGQEKMDDNVKTRFSLDILVLDNTTTLVIENFISDLKELKMWEIRAKSLIKEINDRYLNFENKEKIYSLV
ncbi:hypothetical protein KI387_034747, partial [Taxus chinensis]